TGDNGGFTSPDPDTPATTTTPPIAGRVKVNGCISSIELATGPLDGQAGPNARATVAGNGKGTQDFTWPDGSKPVLTANGRFTAPGSARTSAVSRSPFDDAFADADAGGAYCYWVQAVRAGATRDQVVSSAQSAPAAVIMAPSPFATTPGSGASNGAAGEPSAKG